MKKILIPVGLLLITACGNKAASGSIDTKHDDSVVAATHQQDDQAQQEKQKQEKMKKELTQLIALYNRQLIEMRGQLEAENNELKKIEEFHMLRTEQERKEQIQQQSMKIQTLSQRISSLADALAEKQQQLQALP